MIADSAGPCLISPPMYHSADLRQAGIAVAGEQRLAALPQRLVSVHAAAVVLEERLGHEGHGLAVLVGDVLRDVLVEHHGVGRLEERVELQVDLGLAAGGDFVMMALDHQPAVLHGQRHLGAQVLVVVGRRNREIAFLVARTIAEVVLHAARIPAAFFGVDEVVALVLVLVEAHVVEDEELGLGAEVGGVGQAGGSEIHLGLLGDVARIAIVTLLGDGIDYVAHHHQRRNFGEGIENVVRWHRG